MKIVTSLISVTQKAHVLSGHFDQIIHSAEDVDMVKLLSDLHPKVNKLPATLFRKICGYCLSLCFSRSC